MSTSPQLTASDRYLQRVHEEGRWNRRRTGAVKSGPGPTLPVNRCPSEDQVAWAWEKARTESLTETETDAPIQADLWYCGNPAGEAREFFKLLSRGVSDLEKLRNDIGISEVERADLNAWVEWRPNLKSRIERIVDYRQRTLDEFNRLVAEDAALTTPQTARQPISNSL